MSFTTTARRFYMRHLPEMLLCNHEEDRQRVLGSSLASMPHGDFQGQIVSFFEDTGSEMHHREVLTRMLGLGERRFYHAEHNLLDVPMIEMPTLQAMIERLATINTNLLAEDSPELDTEQQFADYCADYNLWLTSLRDDCLHFVIANSMTMEYGFLARDMVHDTMSSLIPREMTFEETSDGIHAEFHVEGDLHQKIWREMTRRSMPRMRHWATQMNDALAQQPDREWQVAIEEEIDDRGYPRTTYCFLVADSARHVRFEHWDEDVARFTTFSREAHLEAIRAHYAEAIQADIQAIYDELVAEVTQSDVTPLYTRDTGSGVHLSSNLFDK